MPILYMSNFSGQQKAVIEAKERNKVRREKLAGLFLDLSKLTYTALVLGSAVLFFQGSELSLKLMAMLFTGGLTAYMWAWIGNNLLK